MADLDDMSRSSEARDPRVYFAAERTMLAWLRTGIAMMGFGFVVARFGMFLREFAAAGVDHPPQQTGLSLWMGTTLVLLGVWVNIAAAVRHFRFQARFNRGEPFITPRGVVIVVLSLLLAIIGIAMTMYLVYLGLQ